MDQALEAARAGDQTAFARVVTPLRQELQIHCYRMLGSVEETIELGFLAAIQRLPARQRAVLILRDTLDWSVLDTATALGLQRLITAWERADTTALVELLREDAKLIMPPGTTWFAGAADIVAFLAEHVFGEMGTGWRLRETAANRQPAFGLYWRKPGNDTFRAFAIGVLRVDGDAITEIALFQQPELFTSFGLPSSW